MKCLTCYQQQIVGFFADNIGPLLTTFMSTCNEEKQAITEKQTCCFLPMNDLYNSFIWKIYECGELCFMHSQKFLLRYV